MQREITVEEAFLQCEEICRKASLARHVRRMKEALPRYFDFTPETLIVTSARSTELEQVVGVMRKRAAVADANGEPAPVFIVKPDAGAMGRGIFLASSSSRRSPRRPSRRRSPAASSWSTPSPRPAESFGSPSRCRRTSTAASAAPGSAASPTRAAARPAAGSPGHGTARRAAPM